MGFLSLRRILTNAGDCLDSEGEYVLRMYPTVDTVVDLERFLKSHEQDGVCDSARGFGPRDISVDFCWRCEPSYGNANNHLGSTSFSLNNGGDTLAVSRRH